MYCKNCGAQIDDNVLQCPYCDYENVRVAQKEQNEHIEYYDNKTKELKQLPDKIVNKTTKYLLMIAGAVFALFIVAMGVVFVVSFIKSKTDLPVQEKHLQKLEEYYQAGEYDKMSEYLEKKDLRGGSYQKYEKADNIYYTLSFQVETLKAYSEQAKRTEIDLTYFEWNLRQIFQGMMDIEELRDKGFRYGEEKIAQYAEDEYKKALKDYAYITDEELKEITADYVNYDYSKLAKLLKTRMETR